VESPSRLRIGMMSLKEAGLQTRRALGDIFICSDLRRTTRLPLAQTRLRFSNKTPDSLVVLWKTKCIRSVRFTLRLGNIQRTIREVRMRFMKLTTDRASADAISGILNGVCPECGGRMGGPGKEFKCQGDCQRDWRQVWERTLSAGLDWRSNKATTSSPGSGAGERE
jgi:hypothetical protein